MFLLSSMNNTRTYVRLLRHLGVALIFAPEPFTTPFGVAFVLVARYLSKRHEAGVNDHLRETFQYYLTHTARFGDDVDGGSIIPGPVKRGGLIEGPAILGQITGSGAPSARLTGHSARDGTARAADRRSPSRRYETGDSPKVESGRFDTSSRADDVIHHTIDTGWFSRRYESVNGAVAHSSWATTSGGAEPITHHFVNTRLFSQNRGTNSVRQAKAKCRASNTVQRRHGYGSVVGHTTVVRALRNNNRYYDALSRSNVIGG